MDTNSGNSPTGASGSGRKTITYETNRSDTLQSIALKFNMSTNEVMRLNKLRTSSIFPGQQISVYEPAARRVGVEANRPTPSMPIQVPTSDAASSPSPPSSTSNSSSPPSSDGGTRSPLSGGSGDEPLVTHMPLPYASSELPRVRAPMRSGISRHHQSKSLPLLSRLRHERDRKYAFETIAGDDLLAPLQQSYLMTGSSPPRTSIELATSPPTQRRGSSFATTIPDEYRFTEREVLKEHVRYFISEQKNMLGELTITPSKVIFEPELDDPMTRELGLMRSHFQCDMSNVIDVHILDAAEVVAAWRSKLTKLDSDFALPGSPPSSAQIPTALSDGYEKAIDFSGVDTGVTPSDNRPRFIQLAVMASSMVDSRNVDTGRIVYFLINRVAAEIFNRKLHEWMQTARTTMREEKEDKQTLRRSGSGQLQTVARRSSISSISGNAKPTEVPSKSRVSLDGSAIPIPHSGNRGDSDRELSVSAPASNWAKVPDGSREHRRQPSVSVPGPTLKDISVILQTPEIQKKLASILPARYRACTWNLLYSTARHGVSLNTFYMRTRNKGPSVIVVDDSEGYVFGAFVSESWEPRKGFYGTGESLLFSLFPAFNAYPWSGLNDYFMFAREDQLAVGGGGGKFGLWLDSEFLQGASAPCDTFLNACLASQEYFQCSVMECWGFEADS